MRELFNLLVFFGFIIATYFIGKRIEQNHYLRIAQKEEELLHIPSVTAQKCYEDYQIEDSFIVSGNVVISGDYFRMILAGLLKFFGGRIVGYESLIDRARREAVIRMKQEAKDRGAHAVINTRFETSKLDSMMNQNSTGMFEILVYGTALKLKHD
ncbi:MAG: YbjQ family protein [Candidatus Omnitrophica bacterium]|nr:YbjQ family protein [Candidatus Omnitrophota bacterium]